ncbi:Protein of unknown function, partial [Gryllus bimaculatus]
MADRWLLDQIPVADDAFRSHALPVQAPEEWLAETMPLREEADAQGLVTRTLGLTFATERRFFQGPHDTMALRCVARVGGRERQRV